MTDALRVDAPRLSFVREREIAVVDGSQTASVRLDDARGLEPGDTFLAVNPGGDVFAVLTCRARVECSAEQASDAIDAMRARFPHRAKLSVDLELADTTDADGVVEATDSVTVIVWGPPRSGD